jgi:glycosyltransferase involved in cell wall biosynthesis
MARVTVVIAARDAASTLPEMLASLIAQEYRDWEAILVDDASSDETGQMASVLGDRIRVLRHEQPQGPAISRNRAVEVADSELVATLDADDFWTPHYLLAQVRAYDFARAGGHRVALVCSDAEIIDEEGGSRGRWSDRVGLPSRPELEDLLRENFVYNSVLIRRRLFLANGGYRADLIRGEDYDLWLRLVEAGNQIIVNPAPLAVYRLRQAALSADAVRLARSTREVYRLALDRGSLNDAQRTIAYRQMRLHAVLERRAAHAQADLAPAARVLSWLRLAGATLRVALEHPERWAAWLRRGTRPPAGGRHA